MGVIAFMLESPCGPEPRTFREHLRPVRHSALSVPDHAQNDPESDAYIGRNYARLGARRVLIEAANGGSTFDRVQRVALWRARLAIQVGDMHSRMIDAGINARDRVLAVIRDRAERKALTAKAERALLDRAFFGLDALEVIHKRPILTLSRSGARS